VGTAQEDLVRSASWKKASTFSFTAEFEGRDVEVGGKRIRRKGFFQGVKTVRESTTKKKGDWRRKHGKNWNWIQDRLRA